MDPIVSIPLSTTRLKNLHKVYKKKEKKNIKNLLYSFISPGDIPMESMSTKKGMVLPFTPLALSFDDVKYFVDMPAVIF